MKPVALGSKILSAGALKRRLSRLRGEARSKKIVFTNGCFDILHAGHVRYLEQARSQGAYLVVALNSDASVRKLKGRGRPVNPLGDRLEVIASLGAVDAVTWFGEQTPLKLIRALRPDVLVKGGDYNPGDIVGAKEVRSWGGQVAVLPFLEGRSTTAVIKKLARK